MSTKQIDARGLSCPQPVVLVDRAVKDGNTDLEILVDNEVARENVMRLAARRGLKTDVRREGADIVIRTAKA
ncbi:MAG: sulfurtransferase TusA family protein [Candidatus Atribacteria bacterium]|nr:sulfurtransferase TusA family protein [Candidatus Atribacteria bacterium]